MFANEAEETVGPVMLKSQGMIQISSPHIALALYMGGEQDTLKSFIVESWTPTSMCWTPCSIEVSEEINIRQSLHSL